MRIAYNLRHVRTMIHQLPISLLNTLAILCSCIPTSDPPITLHRLSGNSFFRSLGISVRPYVASAVSKPYDARAAICAGPTQASHGLPPIQAAVAANPTSDWCEVRRSTIGSKLRDPSGQGAAVRTSCFEILGTNHGVIGGPRAMRFAGNNVRGEPELLGFDMTLVLQA
jgi:hypothetical protein